MESPYNLVSDDDFELSPVPRDRLDTSTELEVKKQFVIVEIHQLQSEQEAATSENEPEDQTVTKSIVESRPRASIHDAAASPTHTASLDHSIELYKDSEATDILTSLPSSPSGSVKQSVLKKSGQVIGENSGNFSINNDANESEIYLESTASTSSTSVSNGSRCESRVTFAASNPSALLNDVDHPSGNGSRYQLLDETNRRGRGRSLSSSLMNLVKLKPRPHHKKLQRLQSQLDLDDLSKNELELKANLFYHIGNPIKRWKVEKVVPMKLVLQLLKTVCLLIQLILFTLTVPHMRAEFFYESRELFESLFLQNFTQQEEPRDMYTAFSAQQLFSELDFITKRYFQIPSITIGGYDFTSMDEDGNPAPLNMELDQYARADLNATFNTFVLNGTIVTTEFNVSKGDNATDLYIQFSGDPLFNRFVELIVSFQVKNIRIVHPERAECFLFTVQIFFKNDDNNGIVRYFLREKHKKEDCNGTVLTDRNDYNLLYGILTVLDIGIIVMCSISIILTFKSIQRALKLGRAMGAFYKNNLNIELSWWERRALFPAWHGINTFSDIIIIIGSVYKIFVDFNVTFVESPTRVLLGTAMIVQALVILRYISYFKQLNALTRTLYLALPELLKFLLCAVILFMAFAIAGWIILGPYHSKFFTINDTIETLFGLLNGDDIYNTYSMIDPDDDQVAYAYSRIYLYVFLALFIYAVLNLFTSLVIAAYEASTHYDTATENEVRRFVFSGPLTPNGVALKDVTLTKKYVDPKLIKERDALKTNV